MNYGGIGYTIGHELTHSLDNQGLQYDENGISQDWFDEESEQQFYKRSLCFVDQYKKFSLHKMHVSALETSYTYI